MLKEFGQDLKSLRESQNISVAEISAQTRINPKFINMMESGVFNFQPETYIRAFLKEYARCVDVSENILLTDYEKAKSGFYVRKSTTPKQEDKPLSIKPVVESSDASEPKTEEKPVPKEKQSSPPKENWPPPEIRRRDHDEDSKEFSNKTLTQKILLGLLILVIIAGIIYLIDYLTNSGNDNTSNVKPKSFSEISEDYENKIKGNKNKETKQLEEDSLKSVKIDSLKLSIVASKDVRIKVYVDEKRLVEDVIAAKDTMVIAAKDQFRFSASANSSVDLYLNGKHLKKPSSVTGSSIKNIVINKDGIVNE